MGNESKKSNETSLTRTGLKEAEVVRIILQSLNSLGYRQAATALESESGYRLESQDIRDFRASILAGDWDAALGRLPRLNIRHIQDEKSIKYLIGQQKFLELLEDRKLKEAVKVLRQELSTLEIERRSLHRLSSYLMCSSAEDLKKTAEWDGKDGNSRQQLLAAVQHHIPPSVMIPEERLETLLHQALEYQQSRCLYHNRTGAALSLYEDHVCRREQMPRESIAILEGHGDEVWYVAFSHDSRMLASASKDMTVRIWMVGAFLDSLDASPASLSASPSETTSSSPHSPRSASASPSATFGVAYPLLSANGKQDAVETSGRAAVPYITLIGHRDAVSFVSWSPDDTMILTCSNDKKMRLYNTRTGQMRTQYTQHTEAVTACSWLPDNKRLISGSLDKSIILWTVDGTMLYRWTGARVTDLCVTQSGDRVVVICNEKKIRTYRLPDLDKAMGQEDEGRDFEYIQENDPITSLYLTQDDRYALVNLSSQVIHIWDLERKRLVNTLTGHKQGHFIIRSCFGGVNEAFVLSGSEDGKVYLWHRDQNILVDTFPGHSGPVNSVSWPLIRTSVFASASDDHTIRLWGTRPSGQTGATSL